MRFITDHGWFESGAVHSENIDERSSHLRVVVLNNLVSVEQIGLGKNIIGLFVDQRVQMGFNLDL